jgi:Coenzyme PQQ synthesis protein D (PqqD)
MSKTRRPDLTTCTVDGEVVILDRAAGYVHQLNPTASEIWAACDGQHSPQDIAARLRERFTGVTDDAVLHDVETVLTQFEQLGLLLDAPAAWEASVSDASGSFI